MAPNEHVVRFSGSRPGVATVDRPYPAHRRERKVLASLRWLACVVLLGACSTNSTTPTASCVTSLDTTSARPGQKVILRGVPADWTNLSIQGRTSETSNELYVERRTDGGMDVLVPLLSTGAAGGDLTITATSGSAACAPVTVQVQALPAAPGTAQAVSEQLAVTSARLAAAFGVSRSQLLSNSASLPPALLPLVLAEHVLNGPDNPDSLARLLDGTAPLLKGAPYDPALLDRLMASTGLLNALKELDTAIVTAVEEPIVTPASVERQAALTSQALLVDLAHVDTPQKMLQVVTLQARLSAVINSSLYNNVGVALSEMLGLLAFSPQFSVEAMVASAAVWTAQLVIDGITNLLPSSIEPLKIGVTPEMVKGDVAPWSAAATARGGEWVIKSGAILDGFLMVFAPKLESYLLKVGSYRTRTYAKQLFSEFEAKVVSFIAASANTLTGTYLKPIGELYQAGPYTYGPVDVTSPSYSTATTSNPAVLVPGTFPTVKAVGAGVSNLTVTLSTAFPAAYRASGTQHITVACPIRPQGVSAAAAESCGLTVIVSPATAQLAPGGTQPFTAVVDGDTNQAVTWSTTGGTISSSGVLTAPTTEGTVTVTARSVVDPSVTGNAVVTVKGLEPSIRLFVGPTQTCVLKVDGRAYCWGSNGSGEGGNGTFTHQTFPVMVGGGLHFTYLTAGLSYTCGLQADGTAYCWGANQWGQLGDGTKTNRALPTQVVGGLKFMAIGAQHGPYGPASTCGITLEGSAYCWGANFSGQLGNGVTSNYTEMSTVPVAVSGNLRFTAIYGGGRQNCGMVTDGHLYCWGYGDYNFGNGSTDFIAIQSGVPILAAAGRRFASFDGGAASTNCGVETSGTAYCWGALPGNGTVGGSRGAWSPVQVNGGHQFRSVHTMFGHNCGVTTGGAGYCWGASVRGELGDGNTVNNNQLSPVAVVGGHTWSEIGVGHAYSCGVTMEVAVYCWGAAGYTGNSSASDTGIPTRVSVP